MTVGVLVDRIIIDVFNTDNKIISVSRAANSAYYHQECIDGCFKLNHGDVSLCEVYALILVV